MTNAVHVQPRAQNDWVVTQDGGRELGPTKVEAEAVGYKIARKRKVELLVIMARVPLSAVRVPEKVGSVGCLAADGLSVTRKTFMALMVQLFRRDPTHVLT
jgi:hypothetical protein